jgi:hypothetical protein
LSKDADMTVTYPENEVVPSDVMVDLETLGTGPGCAILSIGAVAFDMDAGRIGATFHVLVKPEACRALGLREDRDTVEWWARQSEDARFIFDEAARTGVDVGAALDMFAAFLRSHGGRPRVRVWGNGADFDNAILAHLYRLTGRELPWAFWNSRCFRTLKSVHVGVANEPDRAGVHHNALDDARHQAAWACAIGEGLRERRAA